MGVLIVIMVICGIGGIGGFIMDQKIKNKSRDEKNSELPELNQRIDTVYSMFFNDNAITRAEKLRRLHSKAMQILDEAKQQYLKTNSISVTTDTFSNLGKCGISQTYLYTEVDAFLFDYVYSYIDIAKLYEKCCGSEYFSKKDIDPIYTALNVYSNLKRNGTRKAQSMKIALNQLLYYKIEGSVQHVSNVTGGGVNMQGAVAGAIIGGGAAAIIGSQVGTETKTEIVTKDDRRITFYINGSDGLVTYDVRSKDYDKTIAALRKLIPSKEESVVQIESTKNTKSVDSISSADEIKKFKELLDSGIISQEEFDAKKKQLLGMDVASKNLESQKKIAPMRSGVDETNCELKMVQDSSSETKLENSFMFQVEDFFVITNRGLCVSGEIISGTICVNDNVEIRHAGGTSTPATVIGIASGHEQVNTATVGDNVSFLLAGVTKYDMNYDDTIVKNH